MKTLFTSIILILLTHSAFSQNSIQGCILQYRQVIPEAVNLWKASYRQLRTDNLIGQDTTYDNVTFNLNQLNQMYEFGKTEKGCLPSIVVFRYYMDSNIMIPRIAIGNLGDETNYLIQVNGRDTIVNAYDSELEKKFNFWDSTYIKNNMFVYVKEYYYCWDVIINYVSLSGSLVLENIAHTISPFNLRYEHSNNSDLEGFIAFDIFFNVTFPTHHGRGQTIDLDFAVPCPKNCYTPNTF